MPAVPVLNGQDEIKKLGFHPNPRIVFHEIRETLGRHKQFVLKYLVRIIIFGIFNGQPCLHLNDSCLKTLQCTG